MGHQQMSRYYRPVCDANTTHSRSVGAMLGQRRKRWHNIEPTQGSMSRFCWDGTHFNIIVQFKDTGVGKFQLLISTSTK